MRKALLILCLFAAVPLFAQESPFRVSVLANDIAYTRSDSAGSDWSGGLGAALEYRWNKQWAMELSVLLEEHTLGAVRVDPAGTTILREEVHSYPIDLMAQYHFQNDTRWKPYIGAGLRYVNGVDTTFGQFGNTLSAQFGGGVHFMITPSFSLRLDAKAAWPQDELSYTFRPSIGFGWRF